MRFACSISYLGAGFCGWQSQKNQADITSIQQTIESALTKIANQEINLIVAGRTDAGVNAINQVAHFDTSQIRDQKIWLSGVNHFLPREIRINQIKKVDSSFHARYSAKKRIYRYLIYHQNNDNQLFYQSPFFHNRALTVKEKLDFKAMKKAAKAIIGKHNFNAFRSSDCQAKTATREIFDCKIKPVTANLICIEISANAFLHNMMRILVSALLEVAKHKQPVNYLNQLIQSEKRDFSLKTISPYGLYLYQVQYQKKYPIKRLNKKICLSHFLAI